MDSRFRYWHEKSIQIQNLGIGLLGVHMAFAIRSLGFDLFVMFLRIGSGCLWNPVRCDAFSVSR